MLERGVSVREPDVRACSRQRKVPSGHPGGTCWQSVGDMDLGLRVVKRAGDVRRYP